jgi:hypothetical protein
VIRVRLWLQKPPRVQWVLRVTYDTPDATIIVRTWFDEYAPDSVPPPRVTLPIALFCAGLARAARASDVDSRRYQLDVR